MAAAGGPDASVSPHEALYYFNGNRLEAVRSGPWKLAIAPQGTGMPKGAAQPVKHTGPRLYNLDRDIGERNDVAAQHPEVVERLLKLIEHMAPTSARRARAPAFAPPTASNARNPCSNALPPSMIDRERASRPHPENV